MANEAKAKQRDKQGTYELSEAINGKSSWKSATQAIWYYPEYKDWGIGALSDIGTHDRGITSIGDGKYDCPQQVPKDHWKYFDGSEWQQARSYDASFQCTGTSNFWIHNIRKK